MKILLVVSVCILGIAAFWMNTDRAQSDYDVALASTTVGDHAGNIEILYPLSVGEQIKEAREKMGLSVEDLAKTLEMSNQNIESIESDKAIPTRDVITQIQEVLDTDIVLDARRLKEK